MQRFRKKKDAGRSEPASPELLGGASTRRSAPSSPLLPDNSFRQSLILPHLTKRFALLRSEDGSLVSLDAMEAHLAKHRQTGVLSATEVESVLQQYSVQAAYEERNTVPRLSPTIYRPFPRSSPSEEDSQFRNRTISYRSDTTNDSEQPSSASSIGGNSSAYPFPYDSSPPPESGSPVAITSANFRRGGNSMFGGRVKTMAQLKMVKSGSANSLKSMARPEGADRSPSIEMGSEGDDASLSASSGTAGGLRSRTVSQEEEEAVELARLRDEKDAARLRPPPLDLTQNQLHRISRVLDDYEAELSKTFTRVRNDSDIPLSPSYSDTEAIDPHYHRLAASPGAGDYRRPSAASIISTHTLTSGQATPLTNSDPATPFLSTAIPRLSIDDHDDPAVPAAESGSPLHPSIFPFSADEGLFARKASLTIPDDDREGSQISSNGGTPQSAATSTFPNRPSRSGGDNDLTDDGPFDLSYTPSAAWSKSFAGTPGRIDSVFIPEPVPTIGLESQRSSGSSYHATGVESEDEGGLSRSKSLNGKGKEREEEEEDAGGLLSASTMSRVPSEDLIRELRRSQSGDVDLALHDLVLIQETLVRSASRKAARKMGAGTPGSLSGSEMGLARSTSSSKGRESRIASFSDVQSVSDYRRSTSEPNVMAESTTSVKEEDAVAEVAEVAEEEQQVVGKSTLGAPVLLDPAPQLRTRNMSRRDPASTTSMYVREKADAATMALRKASPVSPGTRLVKSKSIRNIAISNPQFVSGPSDIPAVPIIPAALRDQKETDVDVRRTKSSGIGFRFKMLVKKQSNKELSHLSGDEITPFIDFEPTQSPATTPPFTPPSADSPNFSVVTPSDYPRTPEPIRSPDYYRSPGLRRVEDSDRKSPAVGASPGATLTRLVTRLRRSRKHSDVTGSAADAGVVHISQDASNQHLFDNALSSSSTLHLTSSTSGPRRTSESPAFAAAAAVPIETTIDEGGSEYLGIAGPASRASSTESTGRAAVQYDVSSSRRRGVGSGSEPLASTAPLSLSRGRSADDSAAREDVNVGGGHRATGSIISMNQLRKVAQELGLTDEKAEEFVNLSYGRQVDSPQPDLTSLISTPSDSNLAQSTLPLESKVGGLFIDTRGGEAEEGPTSPVSPTGMSVRSLRSSGYAGSVFDLYGDGDSPEREQEEEEDEGVDERDRMEEEVERVETKEEEEDREVYQVLDDLRNNNRESVDYSLAESTALFRPTSASTATTTSSSVEEVEEPPSIEDDFSSAPAAKKPEAFSELVSRHRRNQSSISQQTQPNSNGQSQFAASFSQYNHQTRAHQEADPYSNRYPSIYVRDEKRLHGLTDGVAESDEGLFLVRPKQNTTGFI